MSVRALLFATPQLCASRVCGPVVDEAALIRALTERWISAAGLDVFEQEPIDPGNPLLKLDNVVVTPHIAGYSDVFWHDFWQHSVETVIDMSKMGASGVSG